MSPDQDAVNLADAVTGLVRLFPAQQDRLDREFAGRLLAYAPLFEAARAAGFEDLARTVAPAAMVIEKAGIEVHFAIARTRGTQSEIRVRLINAGYQRRFEATQNLSHHITLSIQRSELPPDGKDRILASGSPQ